MLVDSHIHLTDDEYMKYLDNIITSLKKLNIIACSVTVNIDTIKKSLELFSGNNKNVIQFIGIHPQFAKPEIIEKFELLFCKNIEKIEGIGEIGLDPTYVELHYNTYEEQKTIFRYMLEIAEKNRKPVSIHSRRSLDDILDILSCYNLDSVILHWFSGSKKQLQRVMDMEIFVSFGPSLLYAQDKKTLLLKSDINKILVETDGPVRYPRCFNYHPSSSISCLYSIANCIRETINISFDETCRILKRNSEKSLKKKLIFE